jgi:hypothetical protein
MDLFYASTKIVVRNGLKTKFWEAPWLHGNKPKDIAPLIFAESKRKKCTVNKAMKDDAWIAMIHIDGDFIIAHFEQFVDLWIKLHDYNFDENLEDTISWTLTEDGQYTAASAYKAQFFGATISNFRRSVWKTWAPPKVKFFAWLALQNRLWTADRLQKRGWPNNGNCPLCSRNAESIDHLLLHCRFTQRLWGLLKAWLGLYFIDLHAWHAMSLKDWWSLMTGASTPNRKGFASVVLLTSWEVWNERNARILRHKHAPPSMVFGNIKNELNLWVAAGAKRVSILMPRE